MREKLQTQTVESFENQQHTHACSGTFNSNRYRSDQLPITSSPLTSSGFCQWVEVNLITLSNLLSFLQVETLVYIQRNQGHQELTDHLQTVLLRIPWGPKRVPGVEVRESSLRQSTCFFHFSSSSSLSCNCVSTDFKSASNLEIRSSCSVSCSMSEESLNPLHHQMGENWIHLWEIQKQAQVASKVSFTAELFHNHRVHNHVSAQIPKVHHEVYL